MSDYARWLEKPYQDACAREERYQAIANEKRQEIWESLEDEVEGEKFVGDHLAAPDELLAEIMREVAICRKAMILAGKMRTGPEVIEGGKALSQLYFKLESYIDEHVEEVAEFKAQRIYDDERN